MMQLEVFGESALMARVAESLIERDGVSRVRCVDAAQAGHAVVTAGVRPRSVDPVLDDLRRLGVKAPDTVLTRVEVVDWAASTRPEVSLVWADVLGQAWLNARPVARYLALMVIRGSDRKLRRHRGEHDPDRRRDGGQPGPPADHRDRRRHLGRRGRLVAEASLTLSSGWPSPPAPRR